MNEDTSIATWALLPALGFHPDAEVLSDVNPGLSCDFGNFRLSASYITNMSFQAVVLFTGAVSTPRAVSEIHFEMPRYVTSREQCAAWIVWHLVQFSILPAREYAWVAEGKHHQNLLPWVIDLVTYEARPQCTVQRPWMRLALRNLAEYLATLDDGALVELGFDGSVLSIRCGGKVVALPAEGKPWATHYMIPAEKLRHLPGRLMHERIGVSVWDSKLLIDRWVYEGVLEVTGNPSNQVHL